MIAYPQRRGRGRPVPPAVLEAKGRTRAEVLRGLSGKQIAAELGVSHGAACRWVCALGFRLRYVTAEERGHLLQRRNA